MSDQNMSLQIFVPLDGFKKLNDILENIKNSLSELVNPLKEIGNHIKSIGKSSSEITILPKLDISIETVRTVLDGVAAILGVVAAVLACIPEPTMITKVIAIVSGVLAASAALTSWMLTLDWNSIGSSMSGMLDGIVNGVDAAWERCSQILNNVVSWIDENFISPIGDFFSDLWEGIKDAFQSGIDFIVGIFGFLRRTLEWNKKRHKKHGERGNRRFKRINQGCIGAY